MVSSQQDRVLDLLRGNYPEYFNSPVIAKILKLNPQSVKVYLSRLAKNGLITKQEGIRGFYRYLDSEEAEKPQITQECECPIVAHTFYMLTPIEKDFLETIQLLPKEGGSPQLHVVTNGNNPTIMDKTKVDFWLNLPYYWDGNKKVRDIIIRQRHLRIEESALKLEVRELSTDGRPYNLIDYDKMLIAMEMLFYPHFHQFDWEFPTWAFNKDHCEIRLEGMKSITFQEVKGTIYRWYEKNSLNATREEIHGSTPFKLEDIMATLGKGYKIPLGTADLRNETKELRQDIKLLRKDYRKQQHLLSKLIDEIHELGGQKPLCVQYPPDHEVTR